MQGSLTNSLCSPLLETGIITQSYQPNIFFSWVRGSFLAVFFEIYKLRCFIKKGHQNMDFTSLNLSIHIYSDFIWSVSLMCNPTYCLSVHQIFRHVLPPLPDLTSLSIKLTCMFCSLNLLYISWEKRSMSSIFSLPFSDLHSYVAFSYAAQNVRRELRRRRKKCS